MSKTKKIQKETPLMGQYNEIKAKYPQALLLFRVGDFYETFGQDAITTANILGIILTSRNNGGSKIELAGFPYHSLDNYLPKLVKAGQRVAVCDQLEAASKTKKIVKRGVTELVTPGLSFNDKVLDSKSNNFLASIYFEKKKAGVSFLDISTGEFFTSQGSFDYIEKLIHSFKPGEVLFPKNKKTEFNNYFKIKSYTYSLEDWVYTKDFANDTLLSHFGINSLKGFGIDKLELGIISAGAILHYLSSTEHNKNSHINSISRIDKDNYMWLDKFTISNLELISPSNIEGTSLLDIIDNTITSMGARMMRKWTILPLIDIEKINHRLDIVNHFYDSSQDIYELQLNLKKIGDLERMLSRLSTLKISPRELAQLNFTLQAIIPVKKYCENSSCEELQKISTHINLCTDATKELTRVLNSQAPSIIGKGDTINYNVCDELDELKNISRQSKEYLLAIQKREIENTGISSLKIAFNNVFGYYIEVRNTHKDKVPEDWIRKQTLTNAERYITEELKELESKILGAQQKILDLEIKLFNALVIEISNYIIPIQINAQIIAKIDCLLSFASTAINNNYKRPLINDTTEISISEGRHPVIEQKLNFGESYVSNNVLLNNETQQIMMITGPNMSGKSALLRQVALIVIMAQMGSYIPAKEASIGLVDKVFTRVGASDNISSGESTFMVEMNETASILNNLSNRSLVLLDEIGRGTSTYDGISIAWAIAEYLHEHKKFKAKTLFATHYHELNEMTNTFDRIKNFNVSVKEINKEIIFLRKLKEGGIEHSFGIHVAKVAGMPKSILDKANEILEKMEKSKSGNNINKTLENNKDMQLSFFQLDDPVLSQIKEEITKIDINSLTPLEALMKLNEIKKILG